MQPWRICFIFLIALTLGWCVISVLGATTVQAADAGEYSELAIHVGHGSLFDPQPDYLYTEFTYTRGQSVDDWISRHLSFNPPGDWDFRVSPSLAILHDPESGIELSCAVGLSVSTKLDQHWKPYIFGASGPLYTSANTTEQATRFNFASYAGYGIEYRIDETQGICMYKLVRHFSNGGIKDPNDGVDTNSWGVSYVWYP